MKKMLSVLAMAFLVLTFGGVAMAAEFGAVIIIHNETSKPVSAVLDYFCDDHGPHPDEGKRTYNLDASGGKVVISDMIDACLAKPTNTFFNTSIDIEGSCNTARVDINGYYPSNTATSKCGTALMGCIDHPLMVLKNGEDDCVIEITYK
jgi:hypothetical protein